jgi:oligopeptide/dipeptide ABC transporter ATP-binding protein
LRETFRRFLKDAKAALLRLDAVLPKKNAGLTIWRGTAPGTNTWSVVGNIRIFMKLIEVDNVTKIYRRGSAFSSATVKAVSDVSLDVFSGECLALVGESGSGKSTLGRLVIGLEPPTQGKILFKGHEIDVRHIDRQTRQALQMVYQNSFEATNPGFTARQVVEEPIRYFRMASGAEKDRIITDLLEKVGIPAIEADKKTVEFSGGQLQRICIARALAAKPEMILLDEPLSSLDVSVQAQILNLLKRLREELGLTYLLISHDLETVYNLADRVAVMYSGSIVEEIDDIDLFRELRHPYTSLLLGTDESDNKRSEDLDTVNDRGCVYSARCKYADERCRNESPALTEIGTGHRLACHRMR